MANAHENINNLIISNTLERISQASSGNWMEGLYTAKTQDDKTRYIHRQSSMHPTSEAWQYMDAILRSQIEENPAFSDTLRTENVPEVKRSMLDLEEPNMLHKLVDKIKDLF